MNISSLKIGLCALFGMLGSVLVELFGGWSETLVTLIAFMVIDFAMGLVLAGVFKNSNKSKTGALDSRAGWKGLCKKCIIMLFVMIAHRMDVLLETDYIRTTAVVGFIFNEAISIIENAGLMGIPLPEVVIRAVESLREDVKNENNASNI